MIAHSKDFVKPVQCVYVPKRGRREQGPLVVVVVVVVWETRWWDRETGMDGCGLNSISK